MTRILVLLGIWTHLAFALPLAQYQAAVVKIQSYLCDGNGDVFRGSGILFWREHHAYVLTSEHVVHRINGPYCHRVWNPSLKTQKVATFLWGDLGTGIALLEVEQVSEEATSVGFKDLTVPRALAKDLPVVVTGFPWKTNLAVTSKQGKVVDPNSAQPFLLNNTNLVEIRDALGEFGMSGGPVFTPDGAFVGMLSHQKLAASGSASSLLYAIPGAGVLNQLENYFLGKSPFLHFPRDPEGELAPSKYSVVIVVNHGFRYRFNNDLYEYYTGNRKPFCLGAVAYWGEEPPTIPYQDSNHFLSRLRSYLIEDKEHPEAQFYLVATNDPTGTRVCANSATDWFLRLSSPGYRLRVNRTGVARSGINEAATELFSLQSQIGQNPLAADLEPLVQSLKQIPTGQYFIPGTIILTDYFTPQWLWQRKAEITNLFNTVQQPHWNQLEQSSPKIKKSLENALRNLETALDVREL